MLVARSAADQADVARKALGVDQPQAPGTNDALDPDQAAAVLERVRDQVVERAGEPRSTRFITREPTEPDPEVIARMSAHPADPARLQAAFGNFGLPERLD